MKNRAKALQTGAKRGTAAVSITPKAALSITPDEIVFFIPAKDLILDNFNRN